jgi:Flp pilus assembly protein TadD
MSRKGRRARSSKKPSVAPSSTVHEAPTLPPPAEPDPVAEALAAPVTDEPPVAVEPPPPLAPQRPQLETPLSFVSQEADASQDDQPDEANIPADDASVPPVDIDNHFFDRMGHHSDPLLEVEERDARALLKATPVVAQRRAQLARYVKFAVAASSVLCLAALVKVAVAHNATDDGVRRPVAAAHAAPVQTVATVETAAPAAPPAATQEAPAAPPAETAAPAAEPVATAAPTAAPAEPPAAPAEPTAAVAPTAAPEAKDPPAVAAADAPPPELDPKAALKEKNACRSSLERGKLADAIEAGERSVALDPTDAEAWLILGASYQEKGDMKNARRSYKACLDQGKRGPKYECAAMPH